MTERVNNLKSIRDSLQSSIATVEQEKGYLEAQLHIIGEKEEQNKPENLETRLNQNKKETEYSEKALKEIKEEIEKQLQKYNDEKTPQDEKNNIYQKLQELQGKRNELTEKLARLRTEKTEIESKMDTKGKTSENKEKPSRRQELVSQIDKINEEKAKYNESNDPGSIKRTKLEIEKEKLQKELKEELSKLPVKVNPLAKAALKVLRFLKSHISSEKFSKVLAGLEDAVLSTGKPMIDEHSGNYTFKKEENKSSNQPETKKIENSQKGNKIPQWKVERYKWISDKMDETAEQMEEIRKNAKEGKEVPLMYVLIENNVDKVLKMSEEEVKALMEKHEIPKIYEENKNNVLSYLVTKKIINMARREKIKTRDDNNKHRSISDIYNDLEEKHKEQYKTQTKDKTKQKSMQQEEAEWLSEKILSIGKQPKEIKKQNWLYMKAKETFDQVTEHMTQEEISKEIKDNRVARVFNDDEYDLYIYKVEREILKEAQERRIRFKDNEGKPKSLQTIYKEIEERTFRDRTTKVSKGAAKNQNTGSKGSRGKGQPQPKPSGTEGRE